MLLVAEVVEVHQIPIMELVDLAVVEMEEVRQHQEQLILDLVAEEELMDLLVQMVDQASSLFVIPMLLLQFLLIIKRYLQQYPQAL
jgi:hypothetical protein